MCKQIVFKILVIFFVLNGSSSGLIHAQFIHPGILHTSESLNRIKTMVDQGKEPWKQGYDVFNKDKRASYEYKMRGPFEFVARQGANPGDPNLHKKEFEDDCLAAYYNALQWIITGNKKNAAKSIEILNGYSTSLKGIINKDKELMAPLCGFLLVNAAEIIRYTNAGWKDQEIVAFEQMIREVFYPVIENFATFANGNWDAACIKGMIAFGVFLNDKAIFNKAVDYYYHGSGNGSIKHYIINDEGQCQESGRDQAHTQFGLGCLAEACEVAFNQGLDLYGAENNRLLKGFEYTAKYNLGFDVPFQEWTDYTGKYHHTQIASQDRGYFRGVYEIVLNHYQKRKNLNPVYIIKAAEKLRPEAAPWTADHPGYGTLLFTIPDK